MMTNKLIDTNILVDSFRAYSPAVSYLGSESKIIISFATLFELINGATDKKNLTLIKRKFSMFDIINITPDIQNLGLELLSEYKFINGIGIIDSMIAATVLYHNLFLVTKNIRHFKGIKGLTLIEPY